MNKTEIIIYDHNVWGWGSMGNDGKIAKRNYGLKALIDAYNADILCLQECSWKIVRAGDNALDDLLFDTYDEVETPLGKHNFTALFYKRQRFDLVDHGFTLFEGRNDSKSKCITWGVFKEKETNVRFGVCSTHFWWKSDDEIDFKQRMENAAVLLEHVNMIKERYGVPVFAAGDLNCGQNSEQGEEPYKWLCNYLLDARLYADKTTDAMTNHAYPWCDSDSVYHATFEVPNITIDHIFVTEHPKVHLDSFDVDNSAVALSTSDHSPLILYATVDGE